MMALPILETMQNYNYRKAWIFTADKILIETTSQLGDRLNGIEVYNRANPMTDVIIRNNKVTQDQTLSWKTMMMISSLPWLHSHLYPDK